MLEYNLRFWFGSGMFGFGIFWWTLFLVNSFKIRLNKAMLHKKYHPWAHAIWGSVWVILGLWAYPSEKTLPLLPLALGIVFGFLTSRRARYF